MCTATYINYKKSIIYSSQPLASDLSNKNKNTLVSFKVPCLDSDVTYKQKKQIYG